MVEQIEEVAGRVAVFAVAQRLLAVERRQRRTGADQADQVEAQARAHLPVLFEKLHAIDIAAREAQARVGLEFQPDRTSRLRSGAGAQSRSRSITSSTA